jgi:hypothetical protein
VGGSHGKQRAREKRSEAHPQLYKAGNYQASQRAEKEANMITVFGEKTTLKDLRKIKPVRPDNAGRRWRPIPHWDLVNVIKDEITMRRWRIKDERYSTARDGADLAGALLLTGVRGVRERSGITLAIGILHSNARRKSLQITVGAEVTCCNNGMCTGHIILKRMHDHTADIPWEVSIALDKYTAAAKKISPMVTWLRRYKLLPNEASEILMKAGRQRLVGWAAIGRVDAEYRNPTFKEHGKDTSWALLNAFTYAARGNIAPTRQMEVYNAFQRLLPLAGSPPFAGA